MFVGVLLIIMLDISQYVFSLVNTISVKYQFGWNKSSKSFCIVNLSGTGSVIFWDHLINAIVADALAS